MAQKLVPSYRQGRAMRLVGTMAVYSSQAEASEKIPEQWREYLKSGLPTSEQTSVVYGASPCTGDRRIHYLCGVPSDQTDPPKGFAELLLEAGEYAVFTADRKTLRDTWSTVLRDWLPSSGHTERNAPEFERFVLEPGGDLSATGIELWVPLESKSDQPRSNPHV